MLMQIICILIGNRRRVQYVANRISSFVRGCLQLGQEAGQNGLNMNLGTVLREKSTHLCNDEAVSER